MQPADDRILEYLDTEGTQTPKSIADEGPYDFHRKTIQRRLRVLSKATLVERIGRGVYSITAKGREYLSGDADLREEPKPG